MAIAAATVSASAGVAQAAAHSSEKAVFLLDPVFLARFPIGKPPAPMLKCQFNPAQLSMSGGAEFSEQDGGAVHQLGPVQFAKPQARSMTVELMFDSSVNAGILKSDSSVADDVDTLFDYTRPRRNHLMTKSSAPYLRFQWGARLYFKCYISSLQATFTLFSSDGKPLRAKASVTLTEVVDILSFTNPTSGGMGGERSHTFRAGDTLSSVAQAFYGNPRFWRGIAAHNGVADPFRVATGTELSLPSSSVVEELS